MLGYRKFAVAMYAITLMGILMFVGKVADSIGIPAMAATAGAYITLEVIKKKVMKWINMRGYTKGLVPR